MGTSITLVIEPKVHLHDMNIFDIGANKPYIDTGKMHDEMSNTVATQIAIARAYFSGAKTQTVQLAMPAYVVDTLAERSPETIVQLRNFITSSKIDLLAMPYYGTSLDVIKPEELQMQLELQKESFQKHFKKRSKTFYASSKLSLEQKEIIQKNLGTTTIVDSKDKTVLFLNNINDAEEFEKLVEEIQSATKTVVLNARLGFKDMKDHLITELQGIYPHIVVSEDNQLLETWRLMAHEGLLSNFDMYSSEQSPYEQYTTMLNMCNDVAHKIKTLALTKRGVFLTDVDVTDSPSQFLRDVMEQTKTRNT